MPVARRCTKNGRKKNVVIDDDNLEMEKLSIANQLDMYLEDFDRQVEIEIESLRNRAEQSCKELRKLAALELLKMTKEVKQMPRNEFLRRGDTFTGKLYLKLHGIEPSPTTTEVAEDSSVIEIGTPTKEAKPEKDLMTEPKTLQPKKARKGAKKVLTSKRRSHVGKSATVTRKRPEQLPQRTPWGCDTPLFTPKFDPRLPLTPATGLRMYKPGEEFVMMSLSGSPIIFEPTNQSPPALITLDTGRHIAVSRRNLEGRNLDDDTRAKLQLMRQQLSALAVSSAS